MWAGIFVKFFVPSRFYPPRTIDFEISWAPYYLGSQLLSHTLHASPKNTVFAFQGFACVLYFLYGKAQVKFKLQLIDRGQGRKKIENLISFPAI